ncbi:MAG: hypothetical protein ABI132_10245 [Rhodanobacteraceae bacterium]
MQILHLDQPQMVAASAAALLVLVGIGFAGLSNAADVSTELDNQKILNFVTTPYSATQIPGRRLFLGMHHGARVVADFICSDVCPNYTVRVIHYDLKQDESCSAVSGIERKALIPFSITATYKAYCFPKVITDNWQAYQKVSRVDQRSVPRLSKPKRRNPGN